MKQARGHSPVPPTEAVVPADAELLAGWCVRADREALKLLIRRHGGMVLATCRRVLGAGPEGDDAFQAVFLLLMRKAATLKDPGRVAGWLHRVALRVAARARAEAGPQQGREVSMVEPAAPEPPENTEDLRRVLDEELARLPDRYRLPILLCEMEGRTLTEAAGQLGWPRGTVAGRLSRGREVLKKRLSRRRGLVLPLFFPLPALLPEILVAAAVAAITDGQAPTRAASLGAWGKGGLGLALLLAAAATAFTASAWGRRADAPSMPTAPQRGHCHEWDGVPGPCHRP